MRWLLRITSGMLVLRALELVFWSRYVVPAEELTPAAVGLASGLAAVNVALAFAFWRAAGETPPNRTVIYTAVIVLLLKTAVDLYELLVVLRDPSALVSLADLVVSVALAVGIIEALPGTLRDPDPGAD